LRREVFEVNEREAARLRAALDTRGEVYPAVAAVLASCALPAPKFHAAAATLRPGDPGGPPIGGGAGGMGGAGRGKGVVPLMGAKVWDEGDPALPALRTRFGPGRVRYFLDMEFGGFTALIKVAMEGRSDAVQRVLDAGAHPDVETSKGCTALSWAALMGHRDVVFVLLRAGAALDYPACTDGSTPLMQAVMHDRVDVVLLILQVMFER
jgi:hypothetical protein